MTSKSISLQQKVIIKKKSLDRYENRSDDSDRSRGYNTLKENFDTIPKILKKEESISYTVYSEDTVFTSYCMFINLK